MDDMTFYRHSFIEKLSKTIAMIHASPDYQKWVKATRRRKIMKNLKGELTIAWRRYHLSKVVKTDRWCMRCEEPIRWRAKSRMCKPCTRKAIRELFRTDMKTDDIAAKLNIGVDTLRNHMSLIYG